MILKFLTITGLAALSLLILTILNGCTLGGFAIGESVDRRNTDQIIHDFEKSPDSLNIYIDSIRIYKGRRISVIKQDSSIVSGKLVDIEDNLILRVQGPNLMSMERDIVIQYSDISRVICYGQAPRKGRVVGLMLGFFTDTIVVTTLIIIAMMSYTPGIS